MTRKQIDRYFDALNVEEIEDLEAISLDELDTSLQIKENPEITFDEIWETGASAAQVARTANKMYGRRLQ